MTGSLAALLFAAALPMTALAARGDWLLENGLWTFRYTDGTYAMDEWQPSGDRWFYLGDNGYMLTDTLVETDGNYYYVDSSGARVTNQWRYTMDFDDEMRWYYFGPTGKALKAPSSGKVSTVEINGKRYAFDSEGRMLYGWVDADNAELLDEDDESAWIEADYYFNGPEDGSAAVGWKELDVVDDGETQTYWFYFGTSGKKNLSSKKLIDNVQYTFDTTDGHMLTGWTAVNATSSDTTQPVTPESAVRYIRNDGSAAKNTWVWAVPDEDYIKEDYDDENYSWWYTNGSGKVYTDEIRKINNKRYALDEYGRMLTGFVTTDADKHNVTKIDEAEYMYEYELFRDRYPIIYYCSDSEADGAIRTGYQTITIDDGPRQFWFNSAGVGTTGYVSSIGKFTVSGMVLCADPDEGAYAAVLVKKDTEGLELDDNINGMLYGRAIRTDGSCVLVNKSGTIQKNKKNLKCDDMYFCTDKDGRVTYAGYEKMN